MTRVSRFRNVSVALLVVAVLLLAAPPALADPPPLIRYQTQLVDSAGVPLTGNHDLTFRIYDLESGGALLWEEGPRSVDLGPGTVDVLLGELTPLNSSVLGAEERWLEVSVDGSVLAPRQRLASVPFSLVTDRLGTKTLADVEAFVPPVGAILPFFGVPAALPANWQICDGTVVADVESPLNGIAVPDLRSRSVRGESDPARDLLSAGVNSGGSDDLPGHSHSSGSAGSHSHSVSGTTPSGGSGNTGDMPSSCTSVGSGSYCVRDDQQGPGTGVHLAVDGGSSSSEGHHRHSTPSHSHSFSATSGSSGNHSHSVSSVSSSVGGNVSRYLALHYIIRIK